MSIFAVLCPDGALSHGDMKQCVSEKWVPIATYCCDGNITTICFNNDETARKFAKRNYPKDWVTGVIALSEDEIQWINNKGWRIEILSYPNLFKDRKDVDFGYEILEFQSKPDLLMRS